MEATSLHFVLSKDLRQNQTIRWLLVSYLFLILIYVVLAPFFESSQLGVFPSQVKRNLLGDPELFIQAKNLEDLIVIIHTKLFLYSTVSLILASVLARMIRSKFVIGGVVSLFLLPALEAVSLIALTSGVEVFALFKSVFFGAYLLLLFVISFSLLILLLSRSR